MENITQKFNSVVSSGLKFNNKYVAAAVSLLLFIYATMAAPALPSFVIRLFDHTIVKILFMFLILVITLNYEPSVSLIVAVVLTVFFMAINFYKKYSETMAIIGDRSHVGIPPFTYMGCGSGKCVRDPADVIGRNEVGEHGEMLVKVDGPISGVSDEEMKSMCMHLKKDAQTNPEIVTSAEFSELQNSLEACEFAKHQYAGEVPNVKCVDQSEVTGKDVEFSTLARIK